ncbi:MAG: hypothetical protein PHV13_00365 [Candidatus ainarchaeum sp.]|nr:hypothetical protein [Candidatus ainarchaeum sp.]
MKWLAALLLFITVANADFLMEQVDVTVSDIKPDGSAHVHESIKFLMFGNYSQSVYDSGMTSNDLSFWSTNVGLKDLKLHVNTAKVDIRDFRLRPQPRTRCNPIQGVCHGELILDYLAYPSYQGNTTMEPLAGTGLFTVEKYKPRTRRYTLNPSALSFTTTPEGNVILEQMVHLTVNPPQDSVVTDVNPQPADFAVQLPAHVDSLSWTDIVLVKFSLIFSVEDSIEKEVADFLSGITGSFTRTLSSPYGPSLIAVVLILAGSYLYITMAKRKGEE